MHWRASAYVLSVVATCLAQQIVLPDHDTSGSHRSQWTTFNNDIKRVAVIGAGPSGLQAAAELLEHNFTVRIFDRAPGPGGNWRYSEEVPVRESYPDAPFEIYPSTPDKLPHTEYYSDGDEGLTLDERWREHWVPRPVWKNLHTNSPTSITELPGVPYGPGAPWSPSQRTVSAHVRAFAALHHLSADDDPAVVSYLTRVERLAKKPAGGWTLTLKRLTRLEESGRIKATWWQEDFDAVVVSLGLDSDGPHVPDIPGLVEWSKVHAHGEPGQHSVYHSRRYRTPERYANKTVLIVGPGTSGSEIARDIAPYVSKLYASSKEYDWSKLHAFQRRSFRRFPVGTEWVPEIRSFEPLETLDNGIHSGKITLINGTVLSGIDEVILATGYIRTNKFHAQVTNDTSKSDGAHPFRHVHWTGHYIPDPTLAFTNCRPWSTVRYQAYGLAKVWKGTARLPSEEELWKQYNTPRFSYFWGFWGSDRSEALLRQWVVWLNDQSLQFGGRLVDQYPLETREAFAYYMRLETQEPDYITRDNFTQFENTPVEDWGATANVDLWDESMFEYGLW